MPTATIRNIPDDVYAALRARAAAHGRSMESEIRTMMIESLTQPQRPQLGLGDRTHALFEGGGIEAPERRADPVRAADLE